MAGLAKARRGQDSAEAFQGITAWRLAEVCGCVCFEKTCHVRGLARSRSDGRDDFTPQVCRDVTVRIGRVWLRSVMHVKGLASPS